MASKVKYKCIFNESWLEDEKYKGWLMKVAGDIYSARCRFCNKNISIAGQGYLQLDSHMKGVKHLRNSSKDDGNSILLHVTPSQTSANNKTLDEDKQTGERNQFFFLLMKNN